jgi:hypothetical protein
MVLKRENSLAIEQNRIEGLFVIARRSADAAIHLFPACPVVRNSDFFTTWGHSRDLSRASSREDGNPGF